MRTVIVEQLEILNSLSTAPLSYFDKIKSYFENAKIRNGTAFTDFTEEGTSTIEAHLRGIYMPLNVENEKINIYDTLIRITTDYAVLSGLSPDSTERKEFIEYILNIYYNIYKDQLEQPFDKPAAFKRLNENFFLVVILLLEIPDI